MANPGLNQILITKKSASSQFVLGADLFEIESQVTNETKIQSVATTEGNEHTVEMFPNQCIIQAKIPSGLYVLQPLLCQNMQVELLARYLVISLKA